MLSQGYRVLLTFQLLYFGASAICNQCYGMYHTCQDPLYECLPYRIPGTTQLIE